MGGGHGHAIRALGVARALQDLRHPSTSCLLLMPARLRPWVHWARVPSASPPPSAHTDPEALGAWTRARLQAFRPDVLVMDVFPRGVLGELADGLEALAPRRLLLTRWVNPRYYLQPDVAAFIRQAFDAIAWSEPPDPALEAAFGDLPGSRRVPPVLFVGPKDVASATACRQAFGIHELARAVVALGSGDGRSDALLLETLGEVAARLEGLHVLFFSDQLERRVTPRLQVVDVFPAGAWLRAGRVVVGGAGYQSYYEIVQSGLPAVFRPLDRLLDDQGRRARGEMGAPRPARSRVALDRAGLEDALVELIEQGEAENQPSRGDLSANLHVLGTSPDELDGAARVARLVVQIAGR